MTKDVQQPKDAGTSASGSSACSTAFGVPLDSLADWLTVQVISSPVGVIAKHKDGCESPVVAWALQAKNDAEAGIITRVIGLITLAGHPALWDADDKSQFGEFDDYEEQ